MIIYICVCVDACVCVHSRIMISSLDVKVSKYCNLIVYQFIIVHQFFRFFILIKDLNIFHDILQVATDLRATLSS